MKNIVGQALRLPTFPDESFSSNSRSVAVGTMGHLFRYDLCRESPTVLANERVFSASKKAATHVQHWNVLAAVLIPDHLHVLVSPIDDRDANLGNFSAALKRSIRQELNAAWNWQPGCFDRLLRSDESLHEEWLYVQDNPVRAGLVQCVADWPYRIGLDDQFSRSGI